MQLPPSGRLADNSAAIEAISVDDGSFVSGLAHVAGLFSLERHLVSAKDPDAAT